MKRLLCFFALLALMVCPALAQNIVGDWQGTLATGSTEAHLDLHIVKAADGTLKATLDQNAKPIPVNTFTLKDSKLTFTVDAANSSYEGTVNSDATEITGLWTQDASRPLNFKRTSGGTK